MVEDDDLCSDIRELAKFVLRGCDIDERHECVFTVAHSNAVFMASGDEPGVIAPGPANGPDRTEPVRTPGVVEAEFLHGVTIPRLAFLFALAPALTIASSDDHVLR
jgi:hypothetical protein